MFSAQPRILIVDDHEVVREGVRIILNRARPHWEICGEAANGPEALAMATELKPDVVILDITMPGMSGLVVASLFAGERIPSKSLMFTMHESDKLIDDAKAAGASGVVAKSDAARDLVAAIETILSGGTFFGGIAEGTSVQENEPQSGTLFRIRLRFT